MSTTLDDFIKRLEQKVEIKVGFPKGKQVVYPPDDRKGHHNKGGQTVAQVATWNEFGTKRIPSRPFLRKTMRDNRKAITKRLAEYYTPKNITDPDYLDTLGILIVEAVQQSIRGGDWVENAESTKRLKKSSKPLIDRGIMINAVNYEVKVTK